MGSEQNCTCTNGRKYRVRESDGTSEWFLLRYESKCLLTLGSVWWTFSNSVFRDPSCLCAAYSKIIFIPQNKFCNSVGLKYVLKYNRLMVVKTFKPTETLFHSGTILLSTH